MRLNILEAIRGKDSSKDQLDLAKYSPDIIEEVKISLGDVYLRILVEQDREPIPVGTFKDKKSAKKIYLVAIRPITPAKHRFVKINEDDSLFTCIFQHKRTGKHLEVPCHQVLALYKPEFNLLKRKVKKAKVAKIKNILLQK